MKEILELHAKLVKVAYPEKIDDVLDESGNKVNNVLLTDEERLNKELMEFKKNMIEGGGLEILNKLIILMNEEKEKTDKVLKIYETELMVSAIYGSKK